MQSICKRLTIVFLIIAFALISDGYGGTVTSGGGTSVGCSDESSSSGTLEVSNTGFAGVTNSKGPIDIYETRFVDDGTHHVDINLQVDNGYVNRYITSYTPKQGGNVRSTSQVGITDTLDIANADQIIVQTNARIGSGGALSASSSVDIQVDRTNTLGAAFKGTTQAYAGKYTQATLNGYVEGVLTSQGTAIDSTNTVTEQGKSSGPIKADLNLKATTRSTSVSSASKFYVDTTWDGKIQDAVDAAWDGDTIKVASGTYNENVEIDKSVAINGAGVGRTVVDGDTDGDDVGDGSVFTISDVTATVALSGMTITNGKAEDGGGIHNAGTLTLKNVKITDNTATYGGGIYNVGGTININSGSSIVSNVADFGCGIYNIDWGIVNMYLGSSITGNTATSTGGGIYNAGGTINMYQGSTIAGNTATYSAGGGIYTSSGTVNMYGGSIADNTAGSSGGGVFSFMGTVNMYQGSSITGNTAAYYGGICNLLGTVNMYKGSSIAGNTATTTGGGIGNLDGIVNMYQGSSITGNKANYGGGISNEDGTVNMYQGSSITGNKATTYGGGIGNICGTVNMYKGSTIADNTADYGGGIYNDNYGTVNFLDSSGNAIAIWPGYDTTKDRYGFFHTAKKQHNTPDDIYPSS